MKKTLHLRLTQRWYDAIASGAKKHEFRKPGTYWNPRLENAMGRYDRVAFSAGYKDFTLFFELKGVALHTVPGNDLGLSGEVWDIELGRRLAR